jgi:hypothetical protein
MVLTGVQVVIKIQFSSGGLRQMAMKSSSANRFLAVMMAVLLPVSILCADTRGAMLSVTNAAVVNGKTIQSNTAIFAGDRVAVPAKGAATITLAGSSILVPAQSSVTFNGDSISLEPQTAVSITTTVGLAAQIEKLKIVPADKSGKFQVARYNGTVVVAAKQGSVVIAGLAGHTVVTEGSTATVTDPEPQKPGSIPATTGIGIGGAEMPAWVAVLVGVAAASAAAAAAIATTGAPATPVKP